MGDGPSRGPQPPQQREGGGQNGGTDAGSGLQDRHHRAPVELWRPEELSERLEWDPKGSAASSVRARPSEP
jgi:hypothetical protein